MRRKIVVFCLIGVLLSYLTATADTYIDSSVDILPIFSVPAGAVNINDSPLTSNSSPLSFPASQISNTLSYGVTFPMSATTFEDGTYLLDYSFTITSKNTTYTSGFYMPIISVIKDNNLSSKATATLNETESGNYYFNVSDCYGYIRSESSKLGAYTEFTISVSIFCNPTTIDNLFIRFGLYDIFKTSSMYYVYENGSCSMFIEDVSSDELQDTLTDNFGSVNQNLTGIQSGLSNVANTITNGNNDLITTMEAVEQAIQDFKEAYPEMTEQATEGALNSFFDKLKQEAVDTANSTVNAIQEQLNIDISGIQNSTQTLYNSISTHAAQPTLTLKAGTVSVAGESFIFWEAQEIDFNEIFNNEWIQLLLIPLRFLFVFGFGRYLLSVVKRIESLVTMNGGD